MPGRLHSQCKFVTHRYLARAIGYGNGSKKMNIMKYVEIVTGPISNEDYLEDVTELMMEHGKFMIEEGVLTNPEAFDQNDRLQTDMFDLLQGYYDAEGDALAEYLQKVYWAAARLQHEALKPLNKAHWNLSIKVMDKFFDLEQVDAQYRAVMAA